MWLILTGIRVIAFKAVSASDARINISTTMTNRDIFTSKPQKKIEKKVPQRRVHEYI